MNLQPPEDFTQKHCTTKHLIFCVIRPYRKTNVPKRCEYKNKDGINSPNAFSNNYHASSKKFRHVDAYVFFNTAETLLHSQERAAAGIGLYVNAHKTEYMCYNQTGDISTLDGTPLKLVDKFTYLGSSVASTEKDIGTRLTKALTVINRLSFIWKSDLTDKMKRSFFQAAVASILLYGCTTWTLKKRPERKLDGNYTRMLRAILNKSWRQHPQDTNCTATCLLSRKLLKLDEPDMQDTAGEAGTNS